MYNTGDVLHIVWCS